MRADRADGRTNRAAPNDNPISPSDDSAHRFARRRIALERFLAKRLFHFKPPDGPGSIGGFVNVGRHRDGFANGQAPELSCHAISSRVASRTAEAIM